MGQYRSTNVGLGINHQAHQTTHQELASLLSGIASYEQAVGRAILAQRSYSYPSPRSASSEGDNSDRRVAEKTSPIMHATTHQALNNLSLEQHTPALDIYTPRTARPQTLNTTSSKWSRADIDRNLSEISKNYIAEHLPSDSRSPRKVPFPLDTPDFGSLLDAFDLDNLDCLAHDEPDTAMS